MVGKIADQHSNWLRLFSNQRGRCQDASHFGRLRILENIDNFEVVVAFD
jgi:hypothetical protein